MAGMANVRGGNVADETKPTADVDEKTLALLKELEENGRYVDPVWHYAFRFPSTWHRFKLAEGHTGVMFSGYATDSLTHFAVEVKELEDEVAEDDLEDLEVFYREAIGTYPDCKIDWLDRVVTPMFVGLSCQFTFKDGDETRKRWSKLLHAGHRQYHVTAQAATPEEYDKLLEWFMPMMLTFYVDPDIMKKHKEEAARRV
jgi:hypothetical protein